MAAKQIKARMSDQKLANEMRIEWIMKFGMELVWWLERRVPGMNAAKQAMNGK